MTERGTAYDVVIIGGGAAGLAGALALGRARRSVLVLDAGKPRNATATHVHNYLGRDGSPPLALLAGGREEVARYGVEVRSATAIAARATDGGFHVELADGSSATARRLLLATGLVDQLPDEVKGLAERWGRDALHCPYCHGWEVQDQVLAVLATGPGAAEQALLFRQWSRSVLLLRHTTGPLTAEQQEQLAARGIPVIDGTVTAVETADYRLVGLRLSSGQVIAADAVVVMPTLTARTEVLADLGLHPAPWPTDASTGTALLAGPGGATGVPGVWAAGNATDLYAGVLQSAAAGITAGAAINADLVKEETANAVADHRAATSPETSPGAPNPASEFWDQHYQRAAAQPDTPRMNPAVADVVAGLPPGRVLDLGCGEGGDSLTLAALGWQVTAVDVSAAVLQRVRDRADAAGLAGSISTERHDLTETVPDGTYDLVSAAYLQSPVALDRAAVLRTVARHVAPGGLLLLIDHGSTSPWSWDQDPHSRHATPAEMLAELDLPVNQWHTERLDSPRRQATGPEGQVAVVTDTVVAVRRRASPRPGQ